jgi:hypothetical protein
MSNTYLDKFRSALPTRQGNQILKLLISKRDSGEIKSVDEFKARLQQLTTTILAERITPTLKLYEAIAGEDASSAQYNEMLDRIQDDLEAGFAEADNLDEIIAAHQNLIQDVVLKSLRFGVNELDSKITLYEFLDKNTQGFDDAIFNTFRESQTLSASRSDATASLVFVDPRKNQVVGADEDCQVDVIGERLILGAASNITLSVREAEWLSNSNSMRGELSASFSSSNILNIIDGRKNTYWVEPVLLSSARTSGVPMEVALHMSSAQDINYIEIEPATPAPMVLVGIDYYDINNTRQSVGTTAVDLRGPTRINFERITTHCLIVRMRQDNYREIQFRQQTGESNFHRAVLGQSYNTIDIDSVNEDLREMLSSDFILSDIFSLGETRASQAKYFEYLLGFDNIRAGFSTFDDRGIFVSKKKTVSRPGIAAVRIDEVRPTQIQGSTDITLESFTYPTQTTAEDAKFYHASVEYWLIAQSFTSDDYLIATDMIPLLPLGAERIYHEHLVFSLATTAGQTKDQGQLMFYTEADSSDVVVYRNGTVLTAVTDWDFIDASDNSGLTVTIPNGGKPMKRGIKINGGVRALDIYTVSYTPTVSNTQVIPTDTTLLKTVDLVGDHSARMVTDNAVVFSDTRAGYAVDHSDMFLLIIMRRNSAEENFSPAVEEHMLVIGSKNTAKFTGD